MSIFAHHLHTLGSALPHVEGLSITPLSQWERTCDPGWPIRECCLFHPDIFPRMRLGLCWATGLPGNLTETKRKGVIFSSSGTNTCECDINPKLWKPCEEIPLRMKSTQRNTKLRNDEGMSLCPSSTAWTPRSIHPWSPSPRLFSYPTHKIPFTSLCRSKTHFYPLQLKDQHNLGLMNKWVCWLFGKTQREKYNGYVIEWLTALTVKKRHMQINTTDICK